jgi:hypothetical protein
MVPLELGVHRRSGFVIRGKPTLDGDDHVSPHPRRVFDVFRAFRIFAVQKLLQLEDGYVLLPELVCNQLVGYWAGRNRVIPALEPGHQDPAHFPRERIASGVLVFLLRRGTIIIIFLTAAG